MAMLELIQMNRVAGESGACLYGPDVRFWPARWADAMATIQAAMASEQGARFE